MLLSKHGRCILLALVMGGTEVKARGYLVGSGNGLPDTSGDTDTTSVDIESSQKGEDSGRIFLRNLGLDWIDCGGHDAPNCEACPYDEIGNYMGSAWCHGNCHWCNGECQSSVCPSLIDCGDNQWGGHDAPICEMCPYDVMGNYQGSTWCGGNCHWCNGECQSSVCPPVDCGGHDAPNCEACPYDASGTSMGSTWCNGNCLWCNGGCQSDVCVPYPEEDRDRHSYGSAGHD